LLEKVEMPPPDTRRICGPESSRDFRIFVSAEKKKEIDIGGRPDGRKKDDEHRPVCKEPNYFDCFHPFKS
jgi:hypothetical protein